jgi:lysozyme
MTPEGIVKLKNHEGLRLKPYTDTVGKLSIGYGRNLDDVGISYDEATVMLDTDLNRNTALARRLDWFDSLDPVRQDIVVMLIFSMGIGGFSTFHNMIQAIKDRNWSVAAYELSNSKWATQVQKERKYALTNALEKGEWGELYG